LPAGKEIMVRISETAPDIGSPSWSACRAKSVHLTAAELEWLLRSRHRSGTTSTRAILFRADTSIAAMPSRVEQRFPLDGRHEPADL
jgi:hypothetical protein